MTQLYPPTTAADITHAKASAAKRLRSNGVVGSESLGSGSEVITEPIFLVEGVDGSGLLSPFRRRDTRVR